MAHDQDDGESRQGLPTVPGIDALVMSVAASAEITIGRLGRLSVQPGYYVYVGSALGPGGLAARVGRHRRDDKRLRWHIDYLRRVAQIEEVSYAAEKAHRECRWAQTLGRLAGASVPLDRFGASDGRSSRRQDMAKVVPAIASRPTTSQERRDRQGSTPCERLTAESDYCGTTMNLRMSAPSRR